MCFCEEEEKKWPLEWVCEEEKKKKKPLSDFVKERKSEEKKKNFN